MSCWGARGERGRVLRGLGKMRQERRRRLMPKAKITSYSNAGGSLVSSAARAGGNTASLPVGNCQPPLSALFQVLIYTRSKLPAPPASLLIPTWKTQ